MISPRWLPICRRSLDFQRAQDHFMGIAQITVITAVMPKDQTTWSILAKVERERSA
jgi:hypothetical protein